MAQKVVQPNIGNVVNYDGDDFIIEKVHDNQPLISSGYWIVGDNNDQWYCVYEDDGRWYEENLENMSTEHIDKIAFLYFDNPVFI